MSTIMTNIVASCDNMLAGRISTEWLCVNLSAQLKGEVKGIRGGAPQS